MATLPPSPNAQPYHTFPAPQRTTPGSGAATTKSDASTSSPPNASQKPRKKTPALFGRKGLHHRIKPIGPGAFDDEIAFNTQSSSQWDGFRHFAHPTYKCHYNGVLFDEIMADIDNNDDDEASSAAPPRSRNLGIDAWAKKGIIGRGVLLDVFSWTHKTGKSYDAFTKHAITADDLRACASSQGTTFQTGDILLIRTGWLATYTSLSPAQKLDRSTMALDQHLYAGLDASDAMKDFLHDSYFAAVAADNACFEVWPPERYEDSLHACMLSLWGMPVGEMWDFEGLAGMCGERARWEVLLVSMPVGVPGGVGRLPNAVAVF